MKRAPELFDTIAVNIDTKEVRVLAACRSLKNAEALTDMAVARRGLDTEFYLTVPTGEYKEGDIYQP